MTALRINLGSGEKYREGWCNVDRYAERADVRQDIRRLHFPEATAVEISCIHTIEHIEREAGAALIERCCRWLKPGGTLEIETPDREKCLALLAQQRPHRRLLGAKGLFGGRSGDRAFKEGWHGWLLQWAATGQDWRDTEVPERFRQRGHAHLYVWTGKELAEAMADAGFDEASIEPPRHHGGREQRDTRVVGRK